MISSIRICGLAGHDDTTIRLDPDGTTEVVGPSGAGKTSLIRAITFALWGQDLDGSAFDVAAIREGADRAEVSLTLKSRTTFTRTMTRKRTTSRVVTRDGADTPCPTEEAFKERLGKLGSATEAIRIAMVPLAWRELAASAGNGRKLRDLFVRLLPGGDLRAEVTRLLAEAGHEFRNDPVDVKIAEETRAEANRRRDAADGRLSECRRRIESLTPATDTAPDTVAVSSARELLALAEAWTAHERDVERHVDAKGAAEQTTAALADWRRRRDELGERPVFESGATIAARHAVEAQDRVVFEARRHRDHALAAIGTAEHQVTEAERADDADLVDARRKLEAAEARVVELKAAGDACPTCSRPGWEQAAKTLEIAQGAAKSAKAYLEQLEKSAPKRRAKTTEKLQASVEQARTDRTAADAALAEAEAKLLELRADLDRVMNAKSAADAWTRAAQALGPEPLIPMVTDLPTAPPHPRPSKADEERATAVIAAADRAKGAAEQRARQEAADKKALGEAEDAAKKARAEAERLDALVKAVRAAPSEIARRQATALGDLGPVQLTFPDGGGIDVLVMGRPWSLASEGELRHADLHLRMAIRRALRLGWLMLTVDNCGAWSGDWPEASPAVFLRTEAIEAIQVRHIRARNAA